MPYLLRLFLTILVQLSPVIVLGILIGLLVKFKHKFSKWLYVLLLVLLIIALVGVVGFLVLLNVAVFTSLGDAFVNSL